MTTGARRDRYHPWKHAAELGVSVVFMPLPPGILGCWDTTARTVFLSPDLDQVERRSTLTHELVHAVRGDEPCATSILEMRQEAHVEGIAALLLIPIDDLARALRWCRDEVELAEELWVDEQIVRTRLDRLSEEDKAFLDHAFWAGDRALRSA